MVNVNPGKEATLKCQDPNSAAIKVLEWRRRDLKQSYVFIYRDRQSFENPFFNGRVELKDNPPKDGDASLILKNASKVDSGIYECRIVLFSRTTRKKRDEPKPISIIDLKVEYSSEFVNI